MKRVFYVILCSIAVILVVFCITKNSYIDTKKTSIEENNDYSDTKIDNELLAINDDYLNIKSINDIIKTNEKTTKIVKTDVKENKTIKTEKQDVEKKNTQQKSSVIKKSSSKNTTKTNNTIKYGTYGRLYISNFNVAVYDFNVNTNSKKDLQDIVNEKDSAAYYINKNKLIIADHNYQGFNVLVNLNIGTTSYIKFKNGNTIKYKLIKKSEGTNTGYDLVDKKGNSFFNMESDIIMYTCYKNGIMVTLWNLA